MTSFPAIKVPAYEFFFNLVVCPNSYGVKNVSLFLSCLSINRFISRDLAHLFYLVTMGVSPRKQVGLTGLDSFLATFTASCQVSLDTKERFRSWIIFPSGWLKTFSSAKNWSWKRQEKHKFYITMTNLNHLGHFRQ